jgi:hypothetical protein
MITAQLAFADRSLRETVSMALRTRALPAATLTAQSNRVVYKRGGLRERYVNGPLGLEQASRSPQRQPAGAPGRSRSR